MRLLQYLLIISLLLLAAEALLLGHEDTASKLLIVTEDVYPMNYLDKTTGEIKGFATDYLRDILEVANIPYEMRVLPWSRAYSMASQEPNILIFGLARTLTREKQFIWLTEFLKLDFHLYGLKSRRDQIDSSSKLYKNNRIGVIKNDFNHTEMAARGYTNLIPADGHKHLALLLIKERVDFIVASSTGLNYFGIRNELDKETLYSAQLIPFLSAPLYYGLSLNTDPAIIDTLRKAVEELENNPHYIKPSIAAEFSSTRAQSD